MAEPIKYIQLHTATDAFADREAKSDRFSLSFPSEQGGCTAVLDRPTLKRLQRQIAYVLSQESSDENVG
jgi:hypothetical protein